ncbi:hypothetical protein PM082_022450 [Marasmius tenuissimus]|nr:hypothetical protein PM082_022450 [Marasmius tenuissimus]
MNQNLLENTLTRFRLTGNGCILSLSVDWNAYSAWLSQAPGVLRACGIALEDDLSVYRLVVPQAWLSGSLVKSPVERARRSQQTIFLFVRSPPAHLRNSKTFVLHFWSFEENGRSRLSPESCLDLGIPIELNYDHYGCGSSSWPNDHYKLINRYQALRGFDPATADFSRYLEYQQIYRPFSDSDRSEQVQEEPTANASMSISSDGNQSKATQAGGFWSPLIWPLPLTVWRDSDIPVAVAL